MEIAERPGQVVDRAQEEVLHGAGRGLDSGRAQWRLAVRREQDAMDPGRLGTAQEAADVVRVLEGVEDEDERRLAAFQRSGQDVVEARVAARLDDERDALMPIEAGQGGE